MNLITYFLLALLAAAQGGPEVEVTLLEADTLRGQFLGLDEQHLALQRGSATEQVQLDTVLGVAFPTPRPGPPAEPQAYVETVDGSSLLGLTVEASAEGVTLTRLDGGKLALPRTAVRSLRFRALDDATLAEWTKLLESDAVADRVVVEREGALDFLEGVVEGVGPEKVSFRLDDELRELPRAKLTGVMLHRVATEAHPLLGRLIDRHGNVVAFAKASRNGNSLLLDSGAGWSAEWPLDDVRRLDFSTGKLLTLTDLAPERNEFSPDPLWSLPGANEATHEAFAPRFDRGFDPGPLSLGGKTFARGVALRPRSQLTYRLPEGYRRFTALVGIDDRLRPRGDAVLTIRADEQTLSKSRLIGGEPPQPVELSIADHHRLSIVVESGQQGDVADVVLLVNPRLSK